MQQIEAWPTAEPQAYKSERGKHTLVIGSLCDLGAGAVCYAALPQH